MEEPGLPSAIKEKKPRTEAQIAAFEKMRAARIEKRLLGEPRKEEEENPEKRKSLEMAAAMFMEMRKKDKESKQKQSWEEAINERVTKRMDEFEDRLINLFQEPVEKYVEKKRAKKQKVEEVKKLDPPVENYVKPATTKVDREEEKPETIYKRPSFAMPKTPSLHKPKLPVTPYKSKQPSYFTKR